MKKNKKSQIPIDGRVILIMLLILLIFLYIKSQSA